MPADTLLVAVGGVVGGLRGVGAADGRPIRADSRVAEGAAVGAGVDGAALAEALVATANGSRRLRSLGRGRRGQSSLLDAGEGGGLLGGELRQGRLLRSLEVADGLAGDDGAGVAYTVVDPRRDGGFALVIAY